MLPNLHSIEVNYNPINLSQLGSFFDALKHAPLRSLVIQLLADKIIPVVVGLPGLDDLRITWADEDYLKTMPKVDLNLRDYSFGLIQPSIDTLQDLRLDFTAGEDQDGTAFDLELLKQAKLHSFSYTVANMNTDVIAQLPKNLPHLKTLSLSWTSWTGQPSFNVSGG
jgi:hypothetical protein